MSTIASYTMLFYLFQLSIAYDGASIPESLMLNTFQREKCLRIPTFVDNSTTVEPTFIISIINTTTIPSFLPLSVSSSTVLVQLSETCVDGDLRLVDSSASSLQGRVQMCLDGVFGYVCDVNGWTSEDASVVCRQMGYIALPSKSGCIIINYVAT